MRTLLCTVALGLGLLSTAQAQERHYGDSISGSGAPSSFEVEVDNGPTDPNAVLRAHYITFSGLSNFGPVHGGYLIAYDLAKAVPDPAACPGSQVLRLPVVVSTSNRAMLLQDGQLFMRDHAASALYCLDLAKSEFTMVVTGDFVGGLGKFEGATGRYEYKGSGRLLAFDRTGLPFGGFELRTRGKVTLPK